MDIVDFRAFNQRFGFAAGDAVLREVADRLRSVSPHVRRAALPGVGGDEFAVLLDNVVLYDTLSQVARQVRMFVGGEPFSVGGQAVRIESPDHVPRWPER